MKALLLTEQHYPAAWVFSFKPISAGSIVPVVKSTNMPASYGECYWVNTSELIDDAYGILLKPGDYQLIDGSV